MSALTIEGLRTTLVLNGRPAHALREITFEVAVGETLAVVGESGCGKSMLAMSVMGLLPAVALISAGRIKVGEREIQGLSEKELEKVRGREIGMIFQEPMTALNPVMTVGSQISEPLRDHLGLSRSAAKARAIELMEQVRIPSAASRYNAYPHEFSGGMRQRVVIALAIACNPRLLIADEPTTALDVTVQRQILDLLLSLQRERQMGMLLITHNLGIVASHAQRVMVMYGGDIAEVAPVRRLFSAPAHPYSRALLASLPRVDRDLSELSPIPGRVPPLPKLAEGCRFQDRCPHAMTRCRDLPPLIDLGEGHAVRCWLHAQEAGDASQG